MKRIYAKVDLNQSAIVKALRQAGCSVVSLAAVGNGCPDLLAARNGNMWLMEIKNGDKCLSAQKLTPDEVRFHATWKAQIHVVKNVDQALNVASRSMMIPNL